MVDLRKHLDLLGMHAADRVTRFSGIVTTIGFDLYGCIQVVLNPGIGDDGKLRDSQWFDVGRLRITSTQPVIEPPKFEWTPVELAKGKKGPAERPRCNKA